MIFRSSMSIHMATFDYQRANNHSQPAYDNVHEDPSWHQTQKCNPSNTLKRSNMFQSLLLAIKPSITLGGAFWGPFKRPFLEAPKRYPQQCRAVRPSEVMEISKPRTLALRSPKRTTASTWYQHDINIVVSYLHHIFIMMSHRIFHKLMTYLTYHDLAPWFSRENFSQLGKTHQQGPGQHRLLVVDAETKGLAHVK